jgi:hypothetical protein
MNWEVANLLVVVGSWFIIWFVVGLFQRKSFLRKNKMFKVGDRVRATGIYRSGTSCAEEVEGTILQVKNKSSFPYRVEISCNNCLVELWLSAGNIIKLEPFKVGDRVAAAAETKGMLGTVTGMPSLHEGGKVTRYAVIWDELPHDWFAPWAHDQEKLPRYKADQLVKLPAEPEFKVGETAARVSAAERCMVKRCMVKAIRFVNGSFCYCYEEGNSGGWVDETMLRKVQPLKAAGPKFGKGLVVLAKPGNIEVWVQVKEIAHKADGSWEYEVVSFSGSSSKIVPECWLKQKPTCQEHSWLDQAPPPLSDDPGLLPPASAKALSKVQADVLQGIMDALPRALKPGGIEHLPGIVAKLVDKAGSATSPSYTNLAKRYHEQEAQQSLEKRQWAKKIQMAEEGANEARAELAAMRERIKKWIEEE